MNFCGPRKLCFRDIEIKNFECRESIDSPASNTKVFGALEYEALENHRFSVRQNQMILTVFGAQET